MGLPNWNPHAQGTKGVELLDVGYGHGVIDAAADAEELQWTSGVTGSFDQLQLYAGSGASAGLLGTKFNSLGRPILLELVNQGDEDWGALTYNDYNCTSVTGSAGLFNENLSTPITTSRLSAPNDGSWIVASTLGAFLEAQFGTGAFPLDRHVLAVEVYMRINISTGVRRFDPSGSPWTYNYPLVSSTFQTAIIRWGEAIVDGSGSVWSHWTPQMIRDFAAGGTRKIRCACVAGPGNWKIDRLLLRVFSIPERRRAVGLGIPSTSQSWIPFAMTVPPATGSPSIASGDHLTLIARRITDYSVDAPAAAVMPWRFMRGRGPDGNWRRHSQPFNPTVNTSSSGTSGLMGNAGPQIDGIPAMRMLNAGTVIADSMPYSLSRGAVCYGANTVSQTLTAAGGATIYGQAYVVAGWVPANGKPVAPLRAELYRVSDGVKILNAVEITAADVERLPVSAPSNNTDDQSAVYKTVQVRFPNSSTLSAVQYELRFSSPDSTADRPWMIAALLGDAHTTDQTFGGSTDAAAGSYRSGSTLLPLTSGGVRSSDLLAQLVEVPAPVTGTGSSVGSITANHVEICDPSSGCQGCAEDTMPFATVTWAPAPSGSPDVAAYHVDRLDDLSPDWERVATVWGRLTARWDDHEARIGVRSQYRIRVVRTDGVTGDWSAPISVTIPTGQVALAFSSNAAQGLGCVYPEVWNDQVTREWAFLEADDIELRKIFGRNRQVAFRPLERRGEAFTRTLLLNALCTVTLPSMATFSPLRDLAWSPIPYVCVRDGEGNRWLASLSVPSGTNRRADAGTTTLWLAEIGITEIEDSPSVHDTSVPQVEGPVQL
jgi:hypothetical protein